MLFEGMKMIFKKLLYLMNKNSKGDIQPVIHDGCQIWFKTLIHMLLLSVFYIKLI